MLRAFCWTLIFFLAIEPGTAIAQPPDGETRKLIIGTEHIPPFAIKRDDGSWDGISIEIWREIATENHWDFELRELDLSSLLKSLENGEIDAAVAAVTVTHNREKSLDFSHPFYSFGLGIAVRNAYRHDWTTGLSRLLAWEFLGLLGMLTVMTIFFGLLMWMLERRRNPGHFGGVLDGIGQGIWWAVVTMTTVGYGDRAPTTLPGRLIAVFWMIVGVISLAVITGTVASHMTVTQLSSPLRGPEDLAHVRTGTVKGTSSEDYLHEQGMTFRRYTNEIEAIKALTNHEIDAVVYDAPTLRYEIHHNFPGQAEVLPVRLQHQDYAIALPPGSALRKPINISLTKIIFEPAWQDTVHRYMGR